MKPLTTEELTTIPIIDLGDLLLRPVSEDDWEDMFEYGSDEDVTKYLAWNAYTKKEDTLNSIKYVFLARPAKGIPAAYAIVHKEDHKMIGTCDFFAVNWDENRGEIGYVLHKKYWGKGYMTRVCQAVITFGFTYLKLDQIDIRHHKENIGSKRVIEKCGFTYVEDSYHKGMDLYLPTYVLHKEDFIKKEGR